MPTGFEGSTSALTGVEVGPSRTPGYIDIYNDTYGDTYGDLAQFETESGTTSRTGFEGR